MDRAGRSPLHYAALSDDLMTAERLIGSGAPVDAQDHQGFTALQFAAQEYSTRVAAAPIDAGASVDIVNSYGNSALFTATFNSCGRGDMIELLRSHAANPRLANFSGQTPVGLARLIGDYDVAQYFDDVKQEMRD